MPVINVADDLFVGNRQATNAHYENQQVWPDSTPPVLEPPGVPSNVAAAATAVPQQLSLTWAPPLTGGTPSSYEVQALDGSWVATGDNTSPSLYTFATAASGAQQMRVRAVNIHGQSSWVTVSGTPLYPAPGVPTSVAVAATGTIGQLSLTWAAPATGVATSYYVEADNGGWVAVGDNTSPSYYTWPSASGLRQMRVRAQNSFGVSAFVTVAGTPTWDTTAPAEATITGLATEDSYGRLIVRFTLSASDNYQYSVDRYSPEYDAGWVNIVGWTSGINGGSYAHSIGDFAANTTGYARVNVRDAVGNVRIGTFTPYYTVRPQVQDVIPQGIGHWRDNIYGGNAADPDRPYQGYFSDPRFNYYGMFYYGTAWYDLTRKQATFGGTIPITSMTVIVARQGGGNNVADCVYVSGHPIQWKPANGTVGGAPQLYGSTLCVAALKYGEYAEPFIGWGNAESLWTGQSFGLALAAPGGKPYMSMYRPDEFVFQGFGKIYSLG